MSDIRATIAVVRCFVSDLPLFFRRSPRTPLRALGVVALDALHVLRYSRRLPPTRVDALALFLDLEGCANAVLDNKDVCEDDWRAIRERLKKAGLGSSVEQYLGRLRVLESGRPSISGDHRHFAKVRAYRESVARLSMTTAAQVALNPEDQDAAGTAATDNDIDALFRILMQCQIIDDILDYPEDLSAGLPSFLTGSASLAESLALTAAAARDYGAPCGRRSGLAVFPLRATLRVITTLTRFMVSTYGITHPRRTHHSIWRSTSTSGR